MFGFDYVCAMFRPTPITPPTASPPALDRRNSNPCRATSPVAWPGSASSFLAKVVSSSSRSPTHSDAEPPSSPRSFSFHEEKIEWETLSRRGSDPSQCGYFSFPDFDRLSSTSGSSRHDESSS